MNGAHFPKNNSASPQLSTITGVFACQRILHFLHQNPATAIVVPSRSDSRSVSVQGSAVANPIQNRHSPLELRFNLSEACTTSRCNARHDCSVSR